ncbi:hypothetical protein Esti_005452 [Eimeria stiedai]
MVASDAVKAEGPLSSGAGGALDEAPLRRQPIASLLQQIYETKILAKLFGGHEAGTSGHISLASAPAEAANQGEGRGPFQGAPLCACARAALAVELLQRVEGRPLQVADLPGGVEAGLIGGSLLKPASRGLFLCSEAAASVPLGLRALIRLLQERLGWPEVACEGGGSSAEENEKVVCEACHTEIRQPLEQLLHACLSFGALCRLSSFPVSPQAAQQLREFASAAARRLRACSEEAAKRAERQTAAEEDGLKKRMRIERERGTHDFRRGLKGGGGDASASITCSSLRRSPPNERIDLQNYVKIQQVGQGAYGDVWLGCEVRSGEWVALKRMKGQQQQQQQTQQQLDPYHHAAAAQQQVLMWHLQNNTEDREGFPKTAIREVSLLRELKGKSLRHNNSNCFSWF